MFSSLLTRHVAHLPNHGVLPGDNDAKSAAALRTANDLLCSPNSFLTTFI